MTTLKVLNLKCGGCANSIKKGLLSVKGIEEVEVNVEQSEITIKTTDESIINEVKNKLSGLGYPEVGEANSVLHKATSFVSCATGKISKK